MDTHELTPTRAEIELLQIDEEDLDVEDEDEENESEGGEEEEEGREEEEDHENNSEEPEEGNEDDSEESEDEQNTAKEDEAERSTEENESDDSWDMDRAAATATKKQEKKGKKTVSREGIEGPSFILIDEEDEDGNQTASPTHKGGHHNSLNMLVKAIATDARIKDMQNKLKQACASENIMRDELAKYKLQVMELEQKMQNAAEKEKLLQLELKDSHKRVSELEKDYNFRVDKMQEQENELKTRMKKIEELEAKIAYMEENNGGSKGEDVRPTPLNVFKSDFIGIVAQPLQTAPPEPSSLVKNVKKGNEHRNKMTYTNMRSDKGKGQ